ncbi:hypothetical protein VNI00_009006 [Paramarasmius palmivorus]|uniref:CENP-V/GFA domain-containing protein n=1 Tax=Paramarasmius palmivorus TaxID=297713 RepID=A0AAW0CP16_9AGAR
MYSTAVPWPSPQPPDVSRLQRYDFSSRMRLYFCGTCSTPMFWGMEGRKEVTVFSGTLENIALGSDTKGSNGMLIRFDASEFVDDTLDGGVSEWLKCPNVDGSKAKRFKGSPGGEEVPDGHAWPRVETKGSDTVPIRCHCKGVNLSLHKGNYQEKPEAELPWFVDPATRKRMAWFDACDSCRLALGVDLAAWTRAELKDISALCSNTTELRQLVDEKDPAIGTLAYYTSSPNVQRYFCSECSACVFYAVDDRPDVVDVAIGVLVAEGGARAEGNLNWKIRRIEFAEDVKDGWRQGFVGRVEKEFGDWTTKHEAGLIR